MKLPEKFKRNKGAKTKNRLSKFDLLNKKLNELELILDDFDRKIRFEFMTEEDKKRLFIETVLEKYGQLIDILCQQMVSKINQHYIDKDDLLQESMEYILRFCYPKMVELSKNSIWVPYLKRSLHNCYVNIQKKHQAKKRKANVVELSNLIIEQVADDAENVEMICEYEDLVNYVISELNDDLYKRVLQDLLNPPISLKLHLILQKFYYKHKKPISSRQIFASYYGVPIKTINTCFSNIRKIVESY